MWAVAASTLFLLGANPYLDQGRTLYRAVRYAEAEVQLRMGLEVPTATPSERREAHDLLARVLLAEGRGAEAEQIYARLLSVDPSSPAPENAAPKVREAFNAAKRAAFPPDYVRLEERTLRPDRFAAELVDPWGKVASLAVVTLGPEGAHPETFPLPLGSRFDVPRPPSAFFVEARDGAGRMLARVGESAAPLRGIGSPPRERAETAKGLEVSGGERHSSRWVGWGLTGAAVVLFSAGVALAVLSDQDYAAAGRSGPALDIRRLDARYREKAIGARVALGAGAVAGLGGGWVLWTWP